MFCVVAFIFLGVMGIFSISCRRLAGEALDCVFRRVTLRPCVTGFDERMKSMVLGKVIIHSETAARILNRHFQLISLALFLLVIASTAWAGRGLYLYYVTGSCGGADSSSFCVFDPHGSHHQVSTTSGICPLSPTPGGVSVKEVPLETFPSTGIGSRDRIIMIGCYGCQHSRKVYYSIRRLAERHHADLFYLNYPTRVKTDLMNRLGSCVYGRNRDAFWRMNDMLFSSDPRLLDDESFAGQVVAKAGMAPDPVLKCLGDPATARLVGRQLEAISGTGVMGTPTVLINDRVFVGPKPYRVYAIALRGLFYWLRD